MDETIKHHHRKVRFLRGAAVLLVLGAVSFITWANWRSQDKSHNQSNAATVLKTLSTAEAVFRNKDLDGNGVNDFWTGDVAGLYRLGLIERAVAEADLRPIIPLVPKPIPYRGYYFIALVRDESETPHEDLRQDTDKKSGKVHHLSKFGFSASPAEYDVTGRDTFIVNENNTVRCRHAYGNLVDCWPSDEDMRHDWAIGD